MAWLITRRASSAARFFWMKRSTSRSWSRSSLAAGYSLGHVSQIPNAGDYVMGRMGEEPVIITRDQQMNVHVFLNSCRHRGNRVCRYDSGNTTVFQCTFHGWTYDLEGK